MVLARRYLRARVHPRPARHAEAGFTLIELMIVIVILPIVVGGISVALISVFSLQSSVANRVGDSNDALVASASFNRDVQSAQQMTTQSTPAACGSLGTGQSQLIAFEWGSNSATAGGPAGGYDTVVSYISTKVVNSQNNTATYALTRQLCTYGTSTTPTSTLTLAHDIGSSPTVTVYGPKNVQTGQFTNVTSDYSTTWASTLDVTKVEFDVQGTQTASGFAYSLVGLPGESTSQSAPSPLSSTSGTSGCGFATPNSQSIYSEQLCFADFTGYNYTQASTGTCKPPGLATETGQLFELPITNTPYTLSFCLQVSANILVPSVLPTYYSPEGTTAKPSSATMASTRASPENRRCTRTLRAS